MLYEKHTRSIGEVPYVEWSRFIVPCPVSPWDDIEEKKSATPILKKAYEMTEQAAASCARAATDMAVEAASDPMVRDKVHEIAKAVVRAACKKRVATVVTGAAAYHSGRMSNFPRVTDESVFRATGAVFDGYAGHHSD